MTVRIVSTPIAGSSLTQLAIAGGDSEWYVSSPSTASQWSERAELVRSSLLSRDWLSALQPAFGGAGAASDRLARAAASGFVVTSGQQPGLFGGPLYTWWKVLSVLALADELQEKTGMPVAPVFWAATDDSDFREASDTIVSTADGAERIEMPEPHGSGVALADLPLGDVSEQLALLETAAGSGADTAVLNVVREAYSPQKTIGGAYVELLRAIAGPLGVSVIDAAHPAVRTLAHPLLLKALERGSAIHEALEARSGELAAAGHAAQVKIVAGRTLAFSEAEGKRERIRIRDASRVLNEAHPGSLGPNVLLRPIVERSILPTVAYLGGPAEIAYFAQVSAVAQAMGEISPLVLPRWSGFVVEPRIERILDRYGLSLMDFADPHAVESRLARSSLPANVTRNIDRMREEVRGALHSIENGEGNGLVPGSVFRGLERNVGHRVERLERRLAASVKRRGNDALRDAAIARGALFPFGHRQERALNVVPLLARYGSGLLEDVLREVRAHTSTLA